MKEQLPDKNIFMMCKALNPNALCELPAGFHMRSCRRDELPLWKAIPFDDPVTADEFEPYMTAFFETTYGGKEDVFFANTLFVCDESDQPVGTCLLWKAYGEFNTIHWLKVLKPFEGLGLGRALLSLIMRDLSPEDYPIYLHTQPESYRAIKLYADFGFELLTDPVIGLRENDLTECLPILKAYMPEKDFLTLKTTQAPASFIECMAQFDTNQF